MKDTRIYLEHILESISRIEAYTERDRDKFMQETLVQDGVLRNLQILAESSQRIPDDLKNRHPGVDWRGISGIRNILVHDYLGIDLERVWGVVVNRLHSLKTEIHATLRELE